MPDIAAWFAENIGKILDTLQVLAGGFLENLYIFLLTLALAIPLGLVITLGSMAKFRLLKYLTRLFVWVIFVFMLRELAVTSLRLIAVNRC